MSPLLLEGVLVSVSSLVFLYSLSKLTSRIRPSITIPNKIVIVIKKICKRKILLTLAPYVPLLYVRDRRLDSLRKYLSEEENCDSKPQLKKKFNVIYFQSEFSEATIYAGTEYSTLTKMV